MVSGKTLKKNTAIVVGSIIALSLVTMNVSYSSFFSVQTQQNGIQTISTGILNVTASATELQSGEMMPTDTYTKITGEGSVVDQDTANNKISLTVTNSGDIDAKFGASIKRTGESESAASLENVIIAIQKNNKWIKFGKNGPYCTAISNLTSETEGGDAYPIIYDTIEKKGTANTVVTYDIYIWLKSETPEEEQGKNLNLSITAKSAPVEGQGEDNSIPDVKNTSPVGLVSEGD